ncbi:hypothetical protein ACET3Z_022778 [Daucus carota]
MINDIDAFLWQNPGLLEKSFSLMLKVPRVTDFDNQRAHFKSKIKQQHDHLHLHGPLRISVRRAYILEGSYNQLRMRSPQDLKGRSTVHFQGEEDEVSLVTYKVVMSDATWSLPFGKFLELSFSNHATANGVASCGHSLQRDCLHV